MARTRLGRLNEVHNIVIVNKLDLLEVDCLLDVQLLLVLERTWTELQEFDK